ncbi:MULTISPECIES: hypothetical protein [Fusobacterium]|uniref:PulJ/GspJ family protein n=1 Tax=Fusobacterium TaxID=848 RepID=UPI001F1B2057|nr:MULTISPECIES: hypothetical protein [Fusobacterium]MCF2611393.1 hypothetical protein [Fusobacterium perfoetens]MDY2981351.1 hypothetical protein [Fusobacterium sp.]
MKKKGFLLVDVLVSIAIFSTVIFSLLILMNKNIENTRKIMDLQEEKRAIFNIENILKRDFDLEKKEKNYEIYQEKNEIFLGEKSKNESIGKFKYISLDNLKNIKIFKREVALNNENIGEMFYISVKIKGKKIEKVIEEKYEK